MQATLLERKEADGEKDDRMASSSKTDVRAREIYSHPLPPVLAGSRGPT